jgi:hypothetical protein
MRRHSLTLLVTALAAGAFAGPAAASSVGVAAGTLSLTAAPGEANFVSLGDQSADSWLLTDVAGITAGPGCSQQSTTSVFCKKAGVTAMRFDLGDRDDQIKVGDNGPVPVEIHGGPGADDLRCGCPDSSATITGDEGNDFLFGGDQNDHLSGGDGNDKLEGERGSDMLDGGAGNDELIGDIKFGTLEAGDDTLIGGAGNDHLTGQGGNDVVDGGDGNDVIAESEARSKSGAGNDAISGGAGFDRVDYSGRVASGGVLHVTLDGRANDGQRSEADNVMPDVEGVTAGPAPSVLVGSAGPNVLVGGSGSDRITGAGGRDVLRGRGGADSIFAADCTKDLVDGGPGRDRAVVDRRDHVRGVERRKRKRCGA